jgi:hypothetical protein
MGQGGEPDMQDQKTQIEPEILGAWLKINKLKNTFNVLKSLISFSTSTVDAHATTPSVSKYKMFYLYEANVYKYLLVCRFTRIYTLKCIYMYFLHKLKTYYI